MVRQDLDLVRADPVALLLLAAAQGCRLCHLQRVRGLAERRVTPVCPPHPIQIGAKLGDVVLLRLNLAVPFIIRKIIE